MDTVIIKVTYDRKSRIKLSEEVIGRKTISDNFDIQLIDSLIKSLIDSRVIKGIGTQTNTMLESDIAWCMKNKILIGVIACL